MVVGGIYAQDATPTPTPIIRVWLPDELISPTDIDLNQLILDQSSAFTEEEGIIVELRPRRTNDVGGILSTLRSASFVAPESLPDLTLMRYQDVLNAQREGLLQPLEGRIASGLLASLGNTLRLGQIENTLYGVPYMIDLSHLVYNLPDEDASRWDYASVLQRNQPIIFSAGRSTLSDMFYVQYVASGDNLAGDGELLPDEASLFSLLSFYESASDSGIVDGFVLNYTSQADYLPLFESGEIKTALLSSTNYLRLREENRTLGIAPIPTTDGRMSSVMNGWVWVLVTPHVEHQINVVKYLAWMMDEEHHAEIAGALQILPSQKTAFRAALRNRDLATFYEQLLDVALMPLNTPTGSFIRALQAGLATVITKERTAQQALEAILQEEDE